MNHSFFFFYIDAFSYNSSCRDAGKISLARKAVEINQINSNYHLIRIQVELIVAIVFNDTFSRLIVIPRTAFIMQKNTRSIPLSLHNDIIFN